MPIPGTKRTSSPRRFQLDEDVYEIDAVEDQWQSSEGAYFAYFKVRSGDKRYLLRYDEAEDQWSLRSGFDGDALLARPGIELVTVDPAAIREAQNQIAGCENCRPDEAEIPFDWILDDLMNKRGMFDFVLAGMARCPNCGGGISEKTLVESQGGIEVEAGV